MKTAVYARFFIWENFQRQNDAVESVAESVAGGEGRYGKRCGGRCGKCCEGRCEGRCGAGREARFYTDILNPVILRIRDLDEILAEEA